MSAARFALSRIRPQAVAIVGILAFTGLFAFVASAHGAQSTIDLCVTKSGPDEGSVRFVQEKLKCKRSELRVRVLGGQQGVLGVQESSNEFGPVGPTGPKGGKGDKGDQGIQGAQGAQGLPGLQGPAGADGKDGADGLDGKDGTDGIDGEDGEDGKDGAPGKDGTNGRDGAPGASRMLVGGLTTSSASDSSNNFYLGAFLTSSATKTEGNVQQVLPLAGTISNLAVKLGSSPGSTDEWKFTVRKNGEGTAVSCTVSASGTSCTNANTVAFATGDQISLEADPNGGPNGWSSARWSVTLTG
jgi:Collagen triple helix repeat (20 copies)